MRLFSLFVWYLNKEFILFSNSVLNYSFTDLKPLTKMAIKHLHSTSQTAVWWPLSRQVAAQASGWTVGASGGSGPEFLQANL